MTALRLYTDGSCHPPGAVGGWAWILVDDHVVASGTGTTRGSSTHQASELTAAIEGLAHLVASGVREVTLLSDSKYLVEGMTCGHCAGSVTKEVSAVDGVTEAVVDLDAKTVTVTGDATEAAIAAAVSEAGYTLAGKA